MFHIHRYMVLWEEWRVISNRDVFNGVYGMLIDDQGPIIRPAKLLTKAHHLQRGDDAVLHNNRVLWVTGDAAERKLYIHEVDAELNYRMVTLN